MQPCGWAHSLFLICSVNALFFFFFPFTDPRRFLLTVLSRTSLVALFTLQLILSPPHSAYTLSNLSVSESASESSGALALKQVSPTRGELYFSSQHLSCHQESHFQLDVKRADYSSPVRRQRTVSVTSRRSLKHGAAKDSPRRVKNTPHRKLVAEMDSQW